VAQAFNNQRELETDAKALQLAAARYTKQTTQWLALVEDLNESLKELGDVRNWARTIETDMRIVCLTI
ncbi:GCN5-like 1, partial [Blyttiomyces helicus]